MCGIAGWLGIVSGGDEIALQITDALRHRGPDEQGIRSWPEATLIHTRLSIIDLSKTGAQPMANEDGTIWTIFNGEIYNHADLRRNLESRGHIFRGRSDTEVLPHLYEEEGLDFLSRLRGMFALAIYDTRSQTLLLARDRFGIKPLFYAPERDQIAFASEIVALLQFPGVNVEPDNQAIHDLTKLSYIPAPLTFYSGIRALEPGQLLKAAFERGEVTWETLNYHRWSITPDYNISLVEATDRAEALITSAVERQLESDVPLGALLSGGIDSSLVSAAAQAATLDRIRTFNVRFSDSEYDETWAALAVAERIGSHHETLEIDDDQGSWDQITSVLSHAGQPFADTSLFAVNALSRVMRQHVTVALSGDGGDEGFGGYNLYWRLRPIALLQRLPIALQRAAWHGAAAAFVPLHGLGVVPVHHSQRAREMAGIDDTGAIQNLFYSVNPNGTGTLFREMDVLPVRRLFEQRWDHHLPQGASRVERLCALATEVNTRLELPNDFLFKVDTASMKESLEVRVPMLDEDLFAFGLSLPYALKARGQVGKLVLRAVARRKLPAKVVDKPKHGFGIPVDRWVSLKFREQLREVLLDPASKLTEFFEPARYRPMLEAFCEGRPYPSVPRSTVYRLAIMLLSVHLALSRQTHRHRRSVRQG